MPAKPTFLRDGMVVFEGPLTVTSDGSDVLNILVEGADAHFQWRLQAKTHPKALRARGFSTDPNAWDTVKIADQSFPRRAFRT